MKSRRAILLCLLLGALMGGCQPLMLGTRPQPKGLPSGVAVFTGSERLSEFSPATSDPSALTPKREAVFLSSARNETTAFQALFSANRSQTRYTFTPSELQMDGG
ncbi:MAG: hypothetical protein HN909_01320, partial [Phycisphaerales bacterium]|nr:hypothetical protein [Phycisphaerales bacterium]